MPRITRIDTNEFVEVRILHGKFLGNVWLLLVLIFRRSTMQSIFFLLLIIASRIVEAPQGCPVLKGYAFEQATVPARGPKRILEEGGKQTESSPKSMTRLLIYLESNNNCSIHVKRIWIARKAYRVKQEEIIFLPVVMQASRPGALADTLVRFTKNKVLQLQLQAEDTVQEKKVLSKLPKGDLIIELEGKSRTKYFSIHPIKKLAPLVLQ